MEWACIATHSSLPFSLVHVQTGKLVVEHPTHASHTLTMQMSERRRPKRLPGCSAS
jgi:hypothetical protein